MIDSLQMPAETRNACAELSGRRFFAWRMALACQKALTEVRQGLSRKQAEERTIALEEASRLLQLEMHSWAQRGEALDIILEKLPRQS